MNDAEQRAHTRAEATHYGVIGLGRVGTVVAARLQDAGRRLTHVSARSDASRRRARAFAPGADVGTPVEVMRSVDAVILAVPDDSLPALVAELTTAALPGQMVAHTSGRHGLDVLRPLADAGVRVVAVHPAMTFTGERAYADVLSDDHRFAVGITAAPGDLDIAVDLARVLGGEPVVIDESDRARYHAALSHGSNHLVTLVAQSRQILAEAGAAEHAELILRPLLEASLDNALRRGDDALTGPVARGDADTVAAHLDSLTAAGAGSPDLSESYRALARATTARAAADGRLDDRAAARLLDVIGAGR